MLSKIFLKNVKKNTARDKVYSFYEFHKKKSSLSRKAFTWSIGNGEAIRNTKILFNWFLVDLRYNELISIISELNGLNISAEDIKQMPYHERCDTLNENYVLVIRHFCFLKQLHLMFLLEKQITMQSWSV